jgi:hypothetical protein
MLHAASCDPLGPWYVGAAWAVLVLAAVAHAFELRAIWRFERRPPP